MAYLFVLPVLLLAMALYVPETATKVTCVSFALGYAAASYVPFHLRRQHIRHQNALLDRCRALYLRGARAANNGDLRDAEAVLMRIRKIERHWHLGNSLIFRISLAVWGIVFGFAACVAIRVPPYLYIHRVIYNNATASLSDAVAVSMLVSATAVLHALFSYFGSWTLPWVIDNCGDRLWGLLHGPKELSSVAGTNRPAAPDLDGLTPEQILGLGLDFTRRDLKQARQRLVKLLHPDLWQQSPDAERRAFEDAMKRVNAAYDTLARQLR